MNFDKERIEIMNNLGSSETLRELNSKAMPILTELKYPLVFDWLSRPVIQWPQDIVAIQELIWKTEPDLIIETGVARGGSLILSASMLALLDLKDSKNRKKNVPPRQVIGIDIEIRDHNRKAIEEHFLSDYIKLITGSSVDIPVFQEVEEIVKNYKKIMVLLDSNHERAHVDNELRLYAPLVSVGSYMVVFDTVIEYIPQSSYKLSPRPWGSGNSPLNSVVDFLEFNPNFIIDTQYDKKLFLSANPSGFLQKTSI